MSGFYARRRDANEPAVKAALLAVGASVTPLTPSSRADDGVPDLLVGFRGATYLIEVKLPKGPKGGTKDRDLNPAQRRWWDAWRGAKPTLARSIEDALRAVGLRVPQPGVWTLCPMDPEFCDGNNHECAHDGNHLVGTYPRGEE